MELKAVNCQTGDPLAQEQVTAPTKENVTDALGEAAAKLRGELGNRWQRCRGLTFRSRATTSSLEALKAFSLAEHLQRDRPHAGLPYYLHAIELDPNFAMGYWQLPAVTPLGELGEPADTLTRHSSCANMRANGKTCSSLPITIPTLPENWIKRPEKYSGGIPRTTRAVTGGYSDLGIVYGAEGQYEKAAEVCGRALRLAPDGSLFTVDGQFALALQRFDEAPRTIHEAQAKN